MGKVEKYFYWFCLALAIYIVIGFKAVPAILHDQLIKNLDNNLTLKSSIEKIEFNPFTLNTKIHNYTLGDIKNPTVKFEQFQLDLGLLESIFKLHANVEQVSLVKPIINIIENKDGSLNLSKLVKPSDSKKDEKAEKSEPSGIKFLVSKIFLEDANIFFSKIKDGKPYELALKNINYNLYDLGTYKNRLSSNNFKLDINDDTKISIEGGFKLEPFTMYGKAYIKDLKLNELLEYKKEILNFDLDKNAKFNTNIDFDIEIKDEFDLKLTTNQFVFENINLTQNKNDLIKLDKLSVDELSVDLAKQKIGLNTVNFINPFINMLQSKDGLNLANLTKIPEEKKLKAKIEKRQEERKENPNSSKPWSVNLSNLALKNSNFIFKDLQNNTLAYNKNFNLNVSNINLNGSKVNINSINMTNPSLQFTDNKSLLNISATNNKNSIGKLSINGENTLIEDITVSKELVVLSDKKARMKISSKKPSIKLDKIDINGTNIALNKLNIVAPYLNINNNKTRLNITTKKAKVNLNKLNIKDKNITISTVNALTQSISINDRKAKLDISTLNTKVDVNDIKLKGSNTYISKVKVKNPKLNFKDNKAKLYINAANTSANISGINLAGDKTTVKKIDLYNPRLDVKDSKSNTNVSSKNLKVYINKFSQNKYGIKLNSLRLYEPSLNIYNTKDKTKILAKNLDLSVSNISNSSKGLKVRKATLTKPNISVMLAKKPKEKKAKKEEVKTPKKTFVKKEPKPTNAKINIGPINIKNATLNFEDNNLPIIFKTKITELNGKVSEINTLNSNTSNLEVNGIVNKYGTTKITGVVDPNNIKILTDINMKFKNIAMDNFSPYTGKFIGREIDSGKLDLDLKYNILKSDLDAKNNIIVTKIKFGKNVQSEDAVSLPLELAIALLEDSNGVIDLKIPVSGNVDDPQFSVAPIVWKAFTNLILKAITAPFSLLGAIFGFSEDEIKSVSFDYGQSDIQPSQKETLDKISQILEKRPNLALKLTPSYIKQKDLLALKKVKYEKILKNELPSKQSKRYNEKHLDLLEDLYEDYDQKLKTLRKEYTSNKNLDKNAYKNALEQYIVSRQDVKTIDLEKMAKDRVSNIKTYLIKEKSISIKQIHTEQKVVVNITTSKTSDINLKISKAK